MSLGLESEKVKILGAGCVALKSAETSMCLTPCTPEMLVEKDCFRRPGNPPWPRDRKRLFTPTRNHSLEGLVSWPEKVPCRHKDPPLLSSTA